MIRSVGFHRSSGQYVDLYKDCQASQTDNVHMESELLLNVQMAN